MKPIRIVSTCRDQLETLRTGLSDQFDADYLTVDDLPHYEPTDITVFDIDLQQATKLIAVKRWLRARPVGGHVVVAIDDTSSRPQFSQACAIGATCILLRPLTAEKLRRTLFRGADVMTLAASELPEEAHDLSSELEALQSLFATAAAGRMPDRQSVSNVGAVIVDKISEIGLADYLGIAKNHHGRTFQHCLSVTAIAIAFARRLNVSRSQTEQIALAGLLHDVGKAFIPPEILEKPSKLDKHETNAVRMHPMLGYEFLQGMPGLSRDILDTVLHHHEYLDGSGYPHRLKGDAISDLSRLITIADVFAALIERRTYKPPMSGAQAYKTLQAMGSKLDATLVREFQPLSRNL